MASWQKVAGCHSNRLFHQMLGRKWWEPVFWQPLETFASLSTGAEKFDGFQFRLLLTLVLLCFGNPALFSRNFPCMSKRDGKIFECHKFCI